MKIYIAHPYGRRRGLNDGECQKNVDKSLEITRQLIKKGHNPLNPLLWHFVHQGWHDTPDEEIYFHLVSSWIEDCDAFFYGGYADGVIREQKIAEALGKKIYYSLDEVP
jgi:hypothetical protein